MSPEFDIFTERNSNVKLSKFLKKQLVSIFEKPIVISLILEDVGIVRFNNDPTITAGSLFSS